MPQVNNPANIIIIAIIFFSTIFLSQYQYRVFVVIDGVNKCISVMVEGSKKAMLRIIKANRGVYFLALTSRPIGSIFAG